MLKNSRLFYTPIECNQVLQDAWKIKGLQVVESIMEIIAFCPHDSGSPCIYSDVRINLKLAVVATAYWPSLFFSKCSSSKGVNVVVVPVNMADLSIRGKIIT